jgi:hypothetical protein
MKKLLFLATLAVVTTSFAAITSQVTFTLTPDDPDLSAWNFTIGIADEATDAYDSGLDANEPPWPPGPEVRMHTLAVPGAASGLLLDYRDGAGIADVPVEAQCCEGCVAYLEAWGLGALDMAYPDLCTIDGANLGITGYTTGVITWDLSQANGIEYCMYVVDDLTGVCLSDATEYPFAVMNRFGAGPTLVITACLVPEPGTMMLVGTGLLALAGLARRR